MPQSIEAAIVLKQQGLHEQALHLLDELIAQDHHDAPRAYYQKALSYVALGQREHAKDAYRRALALRPDYLRALVNLAGQLLIDFEVHQAGQLLARAESLTDPDHDPVLLANRSSLRRLRGEVDGAQRDAERAVELAPDEASVWLVWGFSLGLDPRQASRAAEAFSKALALDPGNAEAHHGLAASLDNSGQHLEALAHAEAALARDGDNTNYLQTMGCILLHLDRPQEALPRLVRVEEARPDHFEAHYNLACAKAKLHALDEAMTHLRRAMALLPESQRGYLLGHLPQDQDLVHLHGTPPFEALLAEHS